MNVTSLEDVLYDWLAPVITPIVPWWMDQNAPRPTGSFVGMRHNAERPLGSRGYKSNPTGPTNTVRVTQDMEFVWMLVGYGVTGAAAIYLVLDALQLPYRLHTLALAGVAYVSNEGVMTVPEVMGSQIETRRALDIRMRVGNVLTYTSNIIETVDMGLTLKEGARTVIHEHIHI